MVEDDMKDCSKATLETENDVLEIVELAISDLEDLMTEISSVAEVFEREEFSSRLVFEEPLLH